MDTTQTNNITPKEKAAWLVLKYMSKVVNMQTAKECALVAVDELYRIAPWSLENDIKNDSKQYWEQVKEEIEKL